MDKLNRQERNIDEMQFCFISRCETTNAILILRQLQNYLIKKKKFYFAFAD